MNIGNQLKRSIISHLVITATLLTSGLIVNVIQLLLHVTIKPFNKKLFHRLMHYVSWTWLARKYLLIPLCLRKKTPACQRL